MTPLTLPLSNGVRARVLEAGAGEPLVLVHGVGLRAEAWGPQIAALSHTHRVFAVDMPGHGGSGSLQDGACLVDFVDWMSQVIRTLDCGPVNLAGHSMGALVATGVAVEHPDLVLRLAVLNAVHRRSPEARAAVYARATEIARGDHDVARPLDRWFGDAAADQAARPQVAAWLQETDRAGYAAGYRVFAEGDDTIADRWGDIACPVLVLTGADDPNSTPAMAHAMAAAAPKGRSVVIDRHRHMANLTAPLEVTAAMADWLAVPVHSPNERARA